MTLRVHTARVTYAGEDRVDVTRQGATADGAAFAPSWTILNPAKTLLATAHKFGAEGEAIEGAAWALYREAYALEMRASYRAHRATWNALLGREHAVLVCFCVDPRRCHRVLLADILTKLGATYAGERR